MVLVMLHGENIVIKVRQSKLCCMDTSTIMIYEKDDLFSSKTFAHI